MSRPKYVYVASSWRNPFQDAVCAVLSSAGIPHYDFKHPDGGEGFHWSDVMPGYQQGSEVADAEEYLAALSHPIAVDGFRSDMNALLKADCCVLVLPCGRSAHLELGWAIGQGKRTAILLDGPLVVPELMYLMADYVAPNVFELLGWLGVED